MKIRIVLALAVLPLALTGCSIHIGPESSQSTKQDAYGSDEIMFAQMMIPHHEQAVEMSSLAPSHTDNDDILALAAQIKAAQEPEIAQMNNWLEVSGVAPMGSHGMTMSGMLSDQELAALKAANGQDFDRLYLEGMIKHHQGAIEMLSMIAGSSNTEVIGLNKAIRDSQTAEIKTMQELLKSY